MKYFELDNYEKKLLKDYDTRKIKSNPNLQREIKRLQAYARATLDKNKNVNLRISEKDLLKIKARAAEKGIPYQTLLASLIHQYSSGQIRDKVI